MTLKELEAHRNALIRERMSYKVYLLAPEDVIYRARAWLGMRYIWRELAQLGLPTPPYPRLRSERSGP